MKWAMVVLAVIILACGCLAQENESVYGGDAAVLDGQPSEVSEAECSEGDIKTAACPDGTIYDSENCVDGKWVTIKYFRNPCKPVYPDAAQGGTFREGDHVSYMGVSGIILKGTIEDSQITTDTLVITDDVGITLLAYSEHPEKGNVEMTTFYREGCVTITIDGRDSGYKLRYDKYKALDDYLLIIRSPDSPTYTRDILERP